MPRRHLKHFEVAGGICHIAWRLHRAQAPLEPTERDHLIHILRLSDGRDCYVIAAVIMDDHVHVLTRLRPEGTSRRLVQRWKSISGHHLCARGRTAPLWQAEYYLRWMNSDRETALCATYIQNNPRRRWPGVVRYPWILP